MGQSQLKTVVLPDEAGTLQWAADLGAGLAGRLPDDRAFVIFLSGPLGAGKSTLARGILRACGVTGPIRSPTYTLLEIYETAPAIFVHVDLYRLGNAVEAQSIGLREYDQAGHVWLVEWPERLAGLVSEADIEIRLQHLADGRGLSAAAATAAGRDVLARLGLKQT
ncbi:MAG: tRNA (adenosine(37)-N6)-threonylcarbamoyltransferase complex ATPase subunit type 1 TsaE [Gammaproteobacteria bacterium]|nr:tRNA (adenosine(37)-N6)-threonylcarbamoyltransferase complex ATPase subunit type 1 TsaE [Gammaproteobacteria bacterium]